MSLAMRSRGSSSLLNGLLECWNFDGATLGLGTLGKNLTLNNTPTTTTGIIGNGANLVRASNQYFSIASGSATAFNPAGDFTVAFWAKPATIAVEMGMVGKYLTTGNQRGWLVELNSASKWNCFMSSGGVAAVSANYSVSAAVGRWDCVVCWWDSANSKVSIRANNGTAAQVAFTGNIFANSAPLNIGTFNNGGAFMFNGVMDNICLWNRALSAGEQTYFYKAGLGRQWPFH